MRIAIVRGATINKWEIQNYEPLVDNFQIEGIYAKPAIFDTKEINFPLKCFYSLAKLFQKSLITHYLGTYLFGNSDYLPFLTKYLKKFDIINTIETFNPATIQALNSKKRNPKQKVIVTIWENIPFSNEIFSKQRKNKARAIKEVDHFIATTERAKNTLILEGVDPNKISVIFMGIDTEKFLPQNKDKQLLKKYNLKNDDFIILTIGRLVWEKGIHDVIKSVKKLIDRDKNIKLLIIGDGPMYNKLIKISKRLNISNNVKIIKKIEYSFIPKIHNLADLFVLASIPVPGWQEQFGMVLIESMACGKPVISTLSGSIPEVIGNCGILVPPADSYELSKHLKKLYKDKALRKNLGNESRKRALELFDANKVSEKIKEIFLKVSNQD